jgi:hypothetical protein
MAAATHVDAPPARRTPQDIVLGVIGAAMVLMAVVLLVMGGESDSGLPRSAAPPALTVAAPVPGATVEGPVEVVFRSAAELGPKPMGWGTEQLHLHLQVDGQQFMPAAGDIRRLPDGSYLWRFGALEPGPHTLRLFWSDTAHRPLAEGASEPLRVQAR